MPVEQGGMWFEEGNGSWKADSSTEVGRGRNVRCKITTIQVVAGVSYTQCEQEASAVKGSKS